MKMTTRCGRTINVTRLAPHDLPTSMGRVVLDTPRALHDGEASWLSLTAGEARRLAGLLPLQAAAVEPATWQRYEGAALAGRARRWPPLSWAPEGSATSPARWPGR